jgi:hypothetical protein
MYGAASSWTINTLLAELLKENKKCDQQSKPLVLIRRQLHLIHTTMWHFFTAYWLTISSLFMTQEPIVDQGVLTAKASRSHSYTPHSVGLPWTRINPDTEIFTWQYTTLINIRHPSRWNSKPIIPQSERPQTLALDRASTGTGNIW